jgi:hypothetical protein
MDLSIGGSQTVHTTTALPVHFDFDSFRPWTQTTSVISTDSVLLPVQCTFERMVASFDVVHIETHVSFVFQLLP